MFTKRLITYVKDCTYSMLSLYVSPAVMSFKCSRVEMIDSSIINTYVRCKSIVAAFVGSIGRRVKCWNIPFDSVGYEHRSLENPLGSLENLPARRALVLDMLEKNFARFSLGSVCARNKLRSSSLGSIFSCSKCSKCARYGTQKINCL